MKRQKLAIPFTLLVLLSLACSLVDTALNTATGGDNTLRPAAQLWPDVPRMDGLTSSPDAELPPVLKIVMRTGVNLMMKGLGDDSPEWDWILFAGGKTPDDVSNFYTPGRMAANGWESDKSACLNGSTQGLAQAGIFCSFTKNQGGKDVGLMIFAVPDDKTKQTTILFVRLESAQTPVANQQPTSGPITKLNGTAPYGVDKRPMPNGQNLDQLLPKQVGPYTRAAVDGTLQVDTNSVYAHYRSGATEVFVEFAVNSSAANAQATLNTASSEVMGGKFPTDPRVGSLGTEPSYLKHDAFYAWTRGGYYFSASAPNTAALDAFMQAFPY